MNNLTKKIWRTGSRDAFLRRGVANRINLLHPISQGRNALPAGLGDSFPHECRECGRAVAGRMKG
jgi:hypothetical protein